MVTNFLQFSSPSSTLRKNLKQYYIKIINTKKYLLRTIYEKQQKYGQLKIILDLLNASEQKSTEESIKILQNPLKCSESEIIKFINNSTYEFIDINTTEGKNCNLLKKLGISPKYLSMNIEAIDKTGVIQQTQPMSAEKIFYDSLPLYENVPDFQNQIETQKNRIKAHFASSKDIALRDGCIYAICPITGELLNTNISFCVDTTCFYRFSGQELFYLILAGPGATKHSIYFPKYELVIRINKIKEQNSINYEPYIQKFKQYLISYRDKVFEYIGNPDKRKTAFIDSGVIGHYVLNTLSGVEELKEDIIKAEKIIISKPLYFGNIESIFPEFNQKDIEIINQNKDLFFEKILDENLFIVKINHWHYVTENLATRIYNAAQKECSTDFLNELEAIRKQHFPIIFINWRLHR